MIKGSIHQEHTTIINMYAQNNRAPKRMMQNRTESEGEISSVVIVGDFTTPLAIIRQKVSKAVDDLSSTLKQLDLSDVCRSLQPTVAGFKFFSSAQGTSSWTDYVLGHKTSLNNFKRLKSYKVSLLTTTE